MKKQDVTATPEFTDAMARLIVGFCEYSMLVVGGLENQAEQYRDHAVSFLGTFMKTDIGQIVIRALTAPPPSVHSEEFPGLRDQFAMAALTGLTADPDGNGQMIAYARDAYALADAMMEVRRPQ